MKVITCEVIAEALREGAEMLTEMFRREPTRIPRANRFEYTIWLKQKGAKDHFPFPAIFVWDGHTCAAPDANAQGQALARGLQAKFN